MNGEFWLNCKDQHWGGNTIISKPFGDGWNATHLWWLWGLFITGTTTLLLLLKIQLFRFFRIRSFNPCRLNPEIFDPRSPVFFWMAKVQRSVQFADGCDPRSFWQPGSACSFPGRLHLFSTPLLVDYRRLPSRIFPWEIHELAMELYSWENHRTKWRIVQQATLPEGLLPNFFGGLW